MCLCAFLFFLEICQPVISLGQLWDAARHPFLGFMVCRTYPLGTLFKVFQFRDSTGNEDPTVHFSGIKGPVGYADKGHLTRGNKRKNNSVKNMFTFFPSQCLTHLFVGLNWLVIDASILEERVQRLKGHFITVLSQANLIQDND